MVVRNKRARRRKMLTPQADPQHQKADIAALRTRRMASHNGLSKMALSPFHPPTNSHHHRRARRPSIKICSRMEDTPAISQLLHFAQFDCRRLAKLKA